MREDLRQAANTLWSRSAGGASDLPDLVWPYFKNADELWEKHQELEKKQQTMGPEVEAKLKAARQKYREENRKRG